MARFLARTGTFIRSQSPPYLEAAYPGQRGINMVPPPLHHSMWQLRFSICTVTYPINYHDIVIRCKKWELHIILLSYVLDTENTVHRIRYYSLLQKSIPSLRPTQTHIQRVPGGSWKSVKRSGCEAGHTPHPATRLGMNGIIDLTSLPICHCDAHRDNLTFTLLRCKLHSLVFWNIKKKKSRYHFLRPQPVAQKQQ